jgi:hypothetical protein
VRRKEIDMKTQLFALLFATVAVNVSADDDVRLSPIAVGADRTVEWACARTGAPSFADMDKLGIGRSSAQYDKRLSLRTLIRNTCHRHGNDALLVLQPAMSDAVPAELVAIR